MSHRTRTILSAILLLCTTTSYAAKNQDRDCVPIATIKAATFTHAVASNPRNLDENNLWILTTDHFEYKNEPWHVWFGFIVENIKTEAEALRRGQAIYNSQVAFFEPTVELNSSQQFVCKYALANNTYSVYAFSPPLIDPR